MVEDIFKEECLFKCDVLKKIQVSQTEIRKYSMT